VIGRVCEFRRSCKSVCASVSVTGCSTSRSSTDLTSVFSVFLQPAREQSQDNDSGDDETSCCLKTLARLATYALPRSIPLHPPLFADTNLISCMFRDMQRIHFISLAVRAKKPRKKKAMFLFKSNPFQWVTKPRDRWLPKDAKRTMNLVHKTNRRPTQASRRALLDFSRLQGTCITTSFLLDVCGPLVFRVSLGILNISARQLAVRSLSTPHAALPSSLAVFLLISHSVALLRPQPRHRNYACAKNHETHEGL
jgi:hypothetical protein